MKTGTRILRGLLLTLTLLAAASRADNACTENGPYTNAVSCVRSGVWVPGVLTPTNLTVGVGQVIAAPTASGYALTNGLGQYYVYFDCPKSGPNYYFNRPIAYTFGNPYYLPALPNVLWTAGTYTYTGMVAATGSPCSPLTNRLGTVTITVVSNNPDVLLDVDFGNQITSAKSGYAALGDGLGDFWNEYSQTNRPSGALSGLKTAEGAVSPVGLLVTNLPYAGLNGSSDPMYDDYLATNTGTATLTFTNLPAGTWNVYLYSQDGNFTLATGATSWGTQTCLDSAPGASPVAWQQGRQYAVFPNVTVGNGQPLTVTINPGINGATLLSGLQIASANHVPAPISASASSVVAWGYDNDGQTNVPAGLNNAVAIACGGYHSLALQANGTVAAWGLNGNGQTSVPASLTNAVAIAGGFYHSLALSGNGTVAAWGWNIYGQTTVPVGLTNVMAIACGTYHSLALRTNGTVAAWGYNAYGQTSVPAGLTNVVAIAAGGYHSLALTANGTVIAWGYNSYGQTNVPAGLSNVVAIAAGGYHSLALTANGTVVAWGDNGNGQSSVPAGLTNVVAIAGGGLHSLALKANGTLVAWGYNGYGETSLPPGLGNVVAIAGGYYHSMALRNATVPASEISYLYRAGAPGSLNVSLDSDYDGVNDLQEVADRTDPYDPNSVLPIQLGYWPFDNTNTWIGSAGQLPLTATNLVGVPSWSTNAVRIDTNKPTILCYRDVETNGNANINLRSGTVQFWFSPDWTSVSTGGSGPGASGRLIELGSNNPVLNANSWAISHTNGWWSLFFTPDGNNLVFGSSTNGAGGVNLSASIAWTSNQWHQVVLTYSPTNSCLYVDGLLAANGAASIDYPNLAERSKGFRIGSDQNGANQARGAFDELQTFNYPLSAANVATNYQNLLNWSGSGSGLPNLWQWINFGYEGVDPTGNPAGDGLSNLQKYQNHLNLHQFYPARLGYWRFNNPPAWLDESNLAPSTAYGLYPVPDWSGDAVRITSALNSALGYPGIRANGSAVAICPAGTGSLRFWFKPEWCSGLGQGPGGVARLFEVGESSTNAEYGWFSLGLDPWGSTLTFSTEANGIHTDNASCPLNFTTNTWYQIVLTYSPTNSAIYVNGVVMSTNGFGVTNLPSQAVLQQGFHFGGSWDGVDQANGDFDELETFNYPLAPSDVASNYQSAMSVLAVDGLPVIVKDGWGLRSDSWDSVCDGVPDAWKLANGYNPNTTNNSAAVLEAYEGITGVSTGAYAHVFLPSDLLNVNFTGGTSSSVKGPLAVGYGAADNWNFYSGQDTLQSGINLFDGGGNETSAKLYAYIGPLLSTYALPYDFDYIGTWDLDGYPFLGPHSVGYILAQGMNVCDPEYIARYCTGDQYYIEVGGPIWNLYQDSGVFPFPAQWPDVESHFYDLYEYTAYIQSWVNQSGIGNTYSIEPAINLNCFISGFNSVTTNGSTFSYPQLADTASDWFHIIHPSAPRAIQIAGLTNGTYDVYIYYTCSSDCSFSAANQVAAAYGTMGLGENYWHCRAVTLSTQQLGGTSLLTVAPPWTESTNFDSLLVYIAEPVVADASGDLNLLDIQIVRLDEVASPSLQVRPGLDAAYLIWQPCQAATNYLIYRSIGSTNNWIEVGSTANLEFQDTNLLRDCFKIQKSLVSVGI